MLGLRWNANLFVRGVADEIHDAIANFEARVSAEGNILRHVPITFLTIVVKVLRLMGTRALYRHSVSRLTRPR